MLFYVHQRSRPYDEKAFRAPSYLHSVLYLISIDKFIFIFDNIFLETFAILRQQRFMSSKRMIKLIFIITD